MRYADRSRSGIGGPVVPVATSQSERPVRREKTVIGEPPAPFQTVSTVRLARSEYPLMPNIVP